MTVVNVAQLECHSHVDTVIMTPSLCHHHVQGELRVFGDGRPHCLEGRGRRHGDERDEDQHRRDRLEPVRVAEVVLVGDGHPVEIERIHVETGQDDDVHDSCKQEAL